MTSGYAWAMGGAGVACLVLALITARASATVRHHTTTPTSKETLP
jgi:hypothetical protein